MTDAELFEMKKRLYKAGEINGKIATTENLMGVIRDNIGSKSSMAIEVDSENVSYCLSGEDIFDDLKYPIMSLLQMRIDNLKKQFKKI